MTARYQPFHDLPAQQFETFKADLSCVWWDAAAWVLDHPGEVSTKPGRPE